MNVSTLRDLLAKELGVSTYDQEITANADVAPTIAIRQNGSRIAFVYVNLSAGDTHRLRPNAAPTATAGLTVGPGEWRSFFYREDFSLVGLEWQVLSSAAGSAFYVLEVLLSGGQPQT